MKSRGSLAPILTRVSMGGVRGASIVQIAMLLAVGLAPAMGRAGIVGMERLVTGLVQPAFATYAPGDRDRLFIIERRDRIRILDLTTGILEQTPFLSIPETDPTTEGGLLGLAFHPNYQANGKFYVYVTVDNGGQIIDGVESPYTAHVREYTVSADPDVANSGFKTILSSVRPHPSHNAGWIGFSPNNPYLYVNSGDGGGAHDNDAGHTPGIGNAQDLTDNLFGKVLRIDINGDDFENDPTRNYAIPPTNPFVGVEGDDEIWAYGLRNPYRASFDRATGDFWIGDVGQGQREEIDYQPAESDGGENYGWRLREGTIATDGGVGGPRPPNNVDPVYDYGRDEGRTVFGGYAYRGPDPELQGQYIFGDSGFIGAVPSDYRFWSLNPADIPDDPGDPPLEVTDLRPLLTPDVGTPRYPVSLGEDAVGNLYAVFYYGDVYRIVTDALTAGDFDADADVDGDDLALWQAGVGMITGANSADGDADDDQDVDGADFLAWQRHAGYSSLDVGAVPDAAVVPEPAGLALGTTWLALVIAARRRAGRRTSGRLSRRRDR